MRVRRHAREGDRLASLRSDLDRSGFAAALLDALPDATAVLQCRITPGAARGPGK